jgi:uncharacterized protein YjbK
MSSSAAHPDPAPHQEIELKWALTASDHVRLADRLTAELGAGKILAQENRFYDTPDRRLRQGRMNLRLRFENGRVVLTCKRKAGGSPVGLIDGLAQHDEWEQELPAELLAGMSAPTQVWSDALPLPEPLRVAMNGAAVESIGGFANRRLEFHVQRGALAELVCLDRTDFGVRIDHELEIETTDPAATRLHWQERFAAWGIAVHPQETTKFARFLVLQGGLAQPLKK